MVLAALAFLALLLTALFGARLAPHEPIFFVVEHGADPRPYDPGLVFPSGSDVLGRDLFSLVLAGARSTLVIVLLAGIARVSAGILVAVLGGWWRPLRLMTEWLAELVSAVPATIVALVIVRVLGRSDTSIAVFIGALLVMGWAGPYRVVRAEVDRLAHAPFTLGARTLGIGRWRMFWRHQLPHLVPVIALNLSQQVIASLVLVAELGVLGTFVGTTRTINIEESLSVVRTGPVNVAIIADPPEWGGLLASARTIESLWTTRWLILVPGLALALTAIALATIGVTIARRYARRDVFDDLRGRGSAAVVAVVIMLVAVSGAIPPRYAGARSFADSARTSLSPSSDTASAFASAGLQPVGESFAIARESGAVVRAGAVRVSIGGRELDEANGRESNAPLNSRNVQAIIYAGTGGGVVQAPVVYAARGISPSEYPPLPTQLYAGALPNLGTLIKEYPDDYAGIDVRGKVVVLVRFVGVATRPAGSRVTSNVEGFSGEDAIAGAIKRGAAAVIFIDPALRFYTDEPESVLYGLGGVRGGPNPYLRLERESPATSTSGVPVIALSPTAAQPLLAPWGVDSTRFGRYDELREFDNTTTTARPLQTTARVDVPLERRSATTTSYVGEVPGVSPTTPRILVWAPRRDSPHPATDVLAALAREVGPRRLPFVFVDFDRTGETRANLDAVRTALAGRTIGLVVVLDWLDGTALRFTTPYGDLIPAFDLYAQEAGARFERTGQTAAISELAEVAPFIDLRTVVVRGAGGSDGDLRPDAAALLGYVAGRLALGAEELPR